MHSSSPARTPKLQLVAEQLLTEECWIPPEKDTPPPRVKEKPQQDGRRGKIEFRIKPHICQRCSEGSNKPYVHQDPETPQRLSQNCVWVSPEEVRVSSGLLQGRGSGCSRPGYGISSLEEVAINPNTEPPELTQDWGNRLLEGTNRTLCTPGPRRKEQ